MWGKIALGVIALLVAVSLFNVFQQGRRPAPVAFSDFMSDVSKGAFTDLVFRGRIIEGRKGDGPSIETMSPFPQEQTARYVYESSKSAPVRISSEEEPLSFTDVALSWVPMLLLIGFWVWFVAVMKRSIDRLSQAVERLAGKTG
jgi:cell division protease FtsH